MTREDIVNAMSLEDAIQVFRDTNCYGTMDIAKTVILNALEQEPKTQFVEKSNFDIRQYNADLQNAYDCGKASQEPKTGHWIKYGVPRCEEQHYKCTSCGYYINFGRWGDLYTKEFKYCPNCGCRMESEG